MNRNKPIKFKMDSRQHPIRRAPWREPRSKPRKHVAWPFERLSLWQSFTAPAEFGSRVGAAGRAWGIRNGPRLGYRREFLVRRISEKSCRCWRIA